ARDAGPRPSERRAVHRARRVSGGAAGADDRPARGAREERQGTARGDRMTILLDGDSLSIEELARIARDPSVRVECDPATDARVAKAEAVITRAVENYRKAWAAGEPAPTEYGVTT